MKNSPREHVVNIVKMILIIFLIYNLLPLNYLITKDPIRLEDGNIVEIKYIRNNAFMIETETINKNDSLSKHIHNSQNESFLIKYTEEEPYIKCYYKGLFAFFYKFKDDKDSVIALRNLANIIYIRRSDRVIFSPVPM